MLSSLSRYKKNNWVCLLVISPSFVQIHVTKVSKQTQFFSLYLHRLGDMVILPWMIYSPFQNGNLLVVFPWMNTPNCHTLQDALRHDNLYTNTSLTCKNEQQVSHTSQQNTILLLITMTVKPCAEGG